MEIISHANVVPWQVDSTFLWQLVELAALDLALLTILGLVYAGLHRVFSNRSVHPTVSIDNTTLGQSTAGAADRAWDLSHNTVSQEGICDEA